MRLIKILIASGISVMLIFSSAALTFGAVASDSVTVTQDVNATITISAPGDVTMSPNITGTGASTGAAIWTVTTNNSAGYKLEVASATTPALKNTTDTISDYTEAVSGTPNTWTMETSASQFGFTANGTDAGAGFSAGTKYLGFTGATKIQVASAAAETTGTATTVGFKTEVGSTKFQPTGTYTATITATATTL